MSLMRKWLNVTALFVTLNPALFVTLNPALCSDSHHWTVCLCHTHIHLQNAIWHKNIITCYTYPRAILMQELFHSCHLKKKHIVSQIILSSSLSELFWDSWTRRGRRRQERQGKSVAAELSSVVGTVHCAVTHHIHSQRGKVHFFSDRKTMNANWKEAMLCHILIHEYNIFES